MIALVIVTHGNLARELLATAQMAFGKTEDVHAVCFSSDQELETLQKRIGDVLAMIGDRPVIFLTDMLGGSAFNSAMKCLAAGKDRFLVTGANLPMLLDILLSRHDRAGHRDRDAGELLSLVRNNLPKYTAIFPGDIKA